ncbi:TPA: KH domain-containing protein [Candidatus Saccharibacteria bacterium]|nr:MAG: Single-stranded nucleic acid binding R3H domain protein [Candidatus Saccharibacteria bacterium GW2011_GWC2_44_17]MBH1956986.1 KH domain-containing protein [Candidatus Saccharibacteria bacterium]OGL23964.1 MAG: single-stranded DNA-binding protein [Candidatus Saccharibacteria bacterium RIFCSPHIGHO2_01_FULL_46_30]OGL33644.1 MAG: single-stranded DNA-binding protein [Candidatus Saccharibacteria bacterium RIFCSPHIGHO2_12_FULL_47_16]MBH1973226.1 KH domain-containing protein [Candidatus Sacchar
MDQQQSVQFAEKYLADLLSFFGINAEITTKLEDDVIELSVPASDLTSLLIGRNAETLRSIQYLVSTTLRNQEAAISRVNVDIADYKKQRADKVAKQAKEWIEEVLRTGDSYIADLNAADRRIVHRVASEYSDIRTFSEGEGRERRIIIAQQSS